jgi:hypothetical protein
MLLRTEKHGTHVGVCREAGNGFISLAVETIGRWGSAA